MLPVTQGSEVVAVFDTSAAPASALVDRAANVDNFNNDFIVLVLLDGFVFWMTLSNDMVTLFPKKQGPCQD